MHLCILTFRLVADMHIRPIMQKRIRRRAERLYKGFEDVSLDSDTGQCLERAQNGLQRVLGGFTVAITG